MSKQNQIVLTLKSFNDFGKDIKVTFDFQLPKGVKEEFSFCVSKKDSFSLIKNVANAMLLSLCALASDQVQAGKFGNWIQKKGCIYMIKNMYKLKIIDSICVVNYRELNDVLSNLIMPAGEFKLVQAAA